MNPSDFIRETFLKRVDLYEREKESRKLYRAVKAMIAKTAQEYTGRALIELIQNGHDAMPATGRNGRIHVLLDKKEGEHGVLYVANTGSPFGSENFDAIVTLGDSNKGADEGIGNKGIGFKSVLHLTDAPEVYSAATDGRGLYDGFSFRFASEDDVVAALHGDRRRARALLGDVASLWLPVPAEDRPARLESFATDGFITVVRLPLRDARARKAAVEQMSILADSEAPLLLFLNRIVGLTVEPTPGDPITLGRSVRAATGGPPPADLTVEHVDLADCGQFLLSRRKIDPSALRAAIGESIAAQQVDESWADWKGDAWIGIAIADQADPIDGRYYAFLPMGGDALSPLAGHVNAPFFTRLARIDLDTELALNDFLMDEVARLTVDTINWLTTVPIGEGGQMVIDLLCWEGPQQDRLVEAFKSRGGVSRAAVIPAVGPSATKFAGLASVHLWEEQAQILTAENLTAHARATLVRTEEIDDERLQRLERFAGAILGHGLDPDPATMGRWVEHIAARLQRRSASPDEWVQFYDELAEFVDADGLVGRKILLDDGGTLRPAIRHERLEKSKDRVVFFHPLRKENEDDTEGGEEFDDVAVPPKLRRRMSFLAKDLDWAPVVDGVRERRPSRRYLGQAGFVREFRVDRVMAVLARVLANTKSLPTRQEALVFAYGLWRSSRSRDGIDLARVGLWVPTAVGDWRPADQTYFGGDWTPVGEVLERLLAASGDASAELASLAARILAPGDVWPLAITEHSSWERFLRAAGVRDGLVPVATGPQKLKGYFSYLTPQYVAGQVGLSERRTADLVAAVEDGGPYGWWQTDYSLDYPVYSLPGQNEFEQLSDEARAAYARLIAHGLDRWADQTFTTSFTKPARPSHTVQWPSPMLAFLQRAAWVPVSDPGRRTDERYVTPRIAWHHRSEPVPRYSTLVVADVRRAFASSEVASSRLDRLGINVWDDDDQALIRHLGSLVADAAVPSTSVTILRNDFRDAWMRLARAGSGDPFITDDDPTYLIVESGSSLRAVLMPGDDEARLYVPDLDDKTRLSLLHALGRPVVPVRPTDGAWVASLLETHLGDRVLPMSETVIEVIADGLPVLADEAAAVLFGGELAWVPEMVGTALLLRSGDFRPVGADATDRAVDVGRRVRKVTASSIGIRLDGHDVPLPPALTYAAPLDDVSAPTIVCRSDLDLGAWKGLSRLAPSVGELIHHPEIAEVLELALIRLQETAVSDRVERPSVSALALALSEPEQAVVDALASLRSEAARLAEHLRPLVVYFSGPAAWVPFEDAGDDATYEQLRALAQESLADAVADADAVIEAAVEGLAWPELGDQLHLDFVRYNMVLRDIGPPFEPIRAAQAQQDQFDRFIQANRPEILARIRAAYTPPAGRLTPAARYAAAWDLEDLEPDESWAEEFYLVPQEALASRIDGWLVGHNAAGLDEPFQDPLAPVAELQHENKVIIGDLVRAWTPLVASLKESTSNLPESEVWAADDPEAAILTLAYRSGITDFRVLGEEDVLRWLTDEGHLPEGFDPEARPSPPPPPPPAPTIDLPEIEVDGTPVGATPDNYETIGAIIDQGLTDEFLGSSPDPTRLLRPVITESPGPGPKGGGGGGGGGGGKEGKAESRNWAIGYAGERAAYKWLCSNYGTDQTRWRSSYQNHYFPGDDGDDSLGYDFEAVSEDGEVLMFEVKATTGDQTRFDLTLGEVRCAQEHARTADYRILHITYVLDSSRRRITVLPNPFGDEASKFRLRDSSVRLEYTAAPEPGVEGEES